MDDELTLETREAIVRWRQREEELALEQAVVKAADDSVVLYEALKHNAKFRQLCPWIRRIEVSPGSDLASRWDYISAVSGLTNYPKHGYCTQFEVIYGQIITRHSPQVQSAVFAQYWNRKRKEVIKVEHKQSPAVQQYFLERRVFRKYFLNNDFPYG
jgi:hypothetical protein